MGRRPLVSGAHRKVDGNRFLIRWAGYSENENSAVEARNVRPLVPKQHPAGTRVEVEWQGSWYPAQVLTGRFGMHLVHYDEFEPVWDEWVSSTQIRLEQSKAVAGSPSRRVQPPG